MPTTPRNLKPDKETHHIYCRGNNGQDVLSLPEEKIAFLNILNKASSKFEFEIMHYVLMSNHYHLLITSDGDTLPKLMHWINRGYSEWHKKKSSRMGRLWQGRYKNKQISDETQLLTCGAYIELNPIKAGITDNPASYVWSSYRHYAFGEKIT